MGVLLGGFDPLKLSEGILNTLIRKGIITQQEGQEIIENAKGQ